MSRVICLGHAALDRLYRIEAFPPHPTKVRAIEHIESGGGMAAKEKTGEGGSAPRSRTKALEVLNS